MFTTVIAIVGLVLAGASLGWQWYTFRLSGSRVQVTARFGIFGSQVKLGPVHDEEFTSSGIKELYLPPDFILDIGEKSFNSTKEIRPDSGYRAIVTVQNSGRSPVTVQRCTWHSNIAETAGNLNIAPGVSLPYRLGEHDQCTLVTDFATVVALVTEYGTNKSPSSRQVWPVVALGNGQVVRGSTLQVPAGARLAPEDPGKQMIEIVDKSSAYSAASRKDRSFRSLRGRFRAARIRRG